MSESEGKRKKVKKPSAADRREAARFDDESADYLEERFERLKPVLTTLAEKDAAAAQKLKRKRDAEEEEEDLQGTITPKFKQSIAEAGRLLLQDELPPMTRAQRQAAGLSDSHSELPSLPSKRRRGSDVEKKAPTHVVFEEDSDDRACSSSSNRVDGSDMDNKHEDKKKTSDEDTEYEEEEENEDEDEEDDQEEDDEDDNDDDDAEQSPPHRYGIRNQQRLQREKEAEKREQAHEEAITARSEDIMNKASTEPFELIAPGEDSDIANIMLPDFDFDDYKSTSSPSVPVPGPVPLESTKQLAAETAESQVHTAPADAGQASKASTASTKSSGAIRPHYSKRKARKCNTTGVEWSVYDWADLSDGSRLKPGQRLKVPADSTLCFIGKASTGKHKIMAHVLKDGDKSCEPHDMSALQPGGDGKAAPATVLKSAMENCMAEYHAKTRKARAAGTTRRSPRLRDRAKAASDAGSDQTDSAAQDVSTSGTDSSSSSSLSSSSLSSTTRPSASQTSSSTAPLGTAPVVPAFTSVLPLPAALQRSPSLNTATQPSISSSNSHSMQTCNHQSSPAQGCQFASSNHQQSPLPSQSSSLACALEHFPPSTAHGTSCVHTSPASALGHGERYYSGSAVGRLLEQVAVAHLVESGVVIGI